MQWYFVEEGKQAGPVSEEELYALVSQGRVTLDTLVWRQGMHNWQRYAEVIPSEVPAGVGAGSDEGIDLYTPAASVQQELGPALVCSNCGNMFPVAEMIRYEGYWVCAVCKPVFVQRLREGALIPVGPAALTYAGFWTRFVAKSLDSIIQVVFSFLLQLAVGAVGAMTGSEGSMMVAGAISMLTGFVVPAVYVTFFVGRYGATPGKMALRLRVVRPDGSAVTYGRACGRYFAEWLSSLTLMIGYIIAGFDEEKRALHDHVCDTRVITV